MKRIVLGAFGAALAIAAANPALACGGGGHAYRAAQHRVAKIPTVTKAVAKTAPTVAPDTVETTGTGAGPMDPPNA